MSLQWTFVATVLYTEIFFVILLLVPFISAYRWQRIFRSRLLNSFRSYSNIYFNIFIFILVILFLDAIRDVRRYQYDDEEKTELQINPAAEVTLHMKLFRAQRNFYIAGFSLFLFLVLRRLVVLISQTAQLEADVEATKKQAEGATEMAKKLLEEKDKPEGTSLDSAELENTRHKLNETKEELQHANKDLSAMRKQAEATNNEYDRLLGEHAKLQKQVATMEGAGDTKKDD